MSNHGVEHDVFKHFSSQITLAGWTLASQGIKHRSGSFNVFKLSYIQLAAAITMLPLFLLWKTSIPTSHAGLGFVFQGSKFELQIVVKLVNKHLIFV